MYSYGLLSKQGNLDEGNARERLAEPSDMACLDAMAVLQECP